MFLLHGQHNCHVVKFLFQSSSQTGEIMQREQRQIFFIIPLLIFVLSGCSVQLSSGYRQSTEIAPILLSQPSPNGIWQGKDISISYSIDSYKPLFALSGTLHINSSILMSYPVITSLFVRIHFLDADGKLLGASPVPINFMYHTFAEQAYSFSFSRESPIQVEAFTFSYSGTFSDYGERFPNTTSIRYLW